MTAFLQNLIVQQINFSETCYIAMKFPKSPPNANQKDVMLY